MLKTWCKLSITVGVIISLILVIFFSVGLILAQFTPEIPNRLNAYTRPRIPYEICDSVIFWDEYIGYPTSTIIERYDCRLLGHNVQTMSFSLYCQRVSRLILKNTDFTVGEMTQWLGQPRLQLFYSGVLTMIWGYYPNNISINANGISPFARVFKVEISFPPRGC